MKRVRELILLIDCIGTIVVLIWVITFFKNNDYVSAFFMTLLLVGIVIGFVLGIYELIRDSENKKYS